LWRLSFALKRSLVRFFHLNVCAFDRSKLRPRQRIVISHSSMI
jgi:hypothetical protein